ncbi:hypothetical protein Q5H92_13800 [Hymenobacter sp. M29]|uniref:Uncharacterized protein n=1 Tax=Hymenobacter mellowenesis TaxID=3063995 RepID=A0ABT9AC65_9BACT|nr:hypothetical protein [Hymenobacter sp. M29]MDO7847439.1 hypothetical protein [Hymenobacter sp. M29]
MANAKKNQKAVASEVAAETTTEQAAEVTTEATAESTEQVADAAAETTTEEAATEKAKRERGYSQTAIDKGDLERLNGFKAHIKETRKLNVSNQTILAAALDCLGTTENMEAFLKGLVSTAADKQRAKDLKAFEALRAKLESTEPAAETEATPEA